MQPRCVFPFAAVLWAASAAKTLDFAGFFGARGSRRVLKYHLRSKCRQRLIDFGLLFSDVDKNKYEFIELPMRDRLGLLLHERSPLAARVEIEPGDIENIPLIVSLQKGDLDYIAHWAGRSASELNIVATYNLVFNATLLVEEGVGSAICFDKLVNTANRGLCFRPLSPPLEVSARIVWKKYQVFSKAASAFLHCLKETLDIKE